MRGRLVAGIAAVLLLVPGCTSGAEGCPEATPDAGTTCEGETSCRYGDHPRYNCRTVAGCLDGSWVVREAECREPKPEFCGTDAAPGAACDATVTGIGPAVEPGQPVPVGAGPACLFQGGQACYCRCVELDGCDPSFMTWECSGPPPTPCPELPPNEGTSCNDDVECEYGLQCEDAHLVFACTDGTWSRQEVHCPN